MSTRLMLSTLERKSDLNMSWKVNISVCSCHKESAVGTAGGVFGEGPGAHAAQGDGVPDDVGEELIPLYLEYGGLTRDRHCHTAGIQHGGAVEAGADVVVERDAYVPGREVKASRV